MTILDTNILVSLLRGTKDATEKIRSFEEGGEGLYTTIITAYELTKGARISSRPQENLAKVHDTLSNLRILNMGLDACDEAAEIYNQLREKGRLIGEFDVLIAAIAKSHDETLVTRDEDFRSVKGLKITKW